MVAVALRSFVLAQSVADGETLDVPYPVGLIQADFTGDFASETGNVVINNNDVYREAEDDVGIFYGEDDIVVTNNSGQSWPVGAEILVQLAYRVPTSGAATPPLDPEEVLDAVTEAVEDGGRLPPDSMAVAFGVTESDQSRNDMVARVAAAFHGEIAETSASGIAVIGLVPAAFGAMDPTQLEGILTRFAALEAAVRAARMGGLLLNVVNPGEAPLVDEDGNVVGWWFGFTPISDILAGTSGKLPPDCESLAQILKVGAGVASASTITLGAGRHFPITGSGGPVTAIVFASDAAGREAVLYFAGTPQINHSASLILPTGANITVEAGDRVWIRSKGSNVIEVIGYFRASGAPLVGAPLGAALTDLATQYTPASASAPASIDLREDTDNGTHEARITPVAALTANRTFTLPDKSGTVLTTAGGETLAAGFNATDFDAGTKSSGTFTPDPLQGNYQKAVNGGAHTLAPPATTSALVIQYTNNATAGVITTSGFTKVTGDAFTTTDGHDFLCDVRRVNGFSHLHVTALQ